MGPRQAGWPAVAVLAFCSCMGSKAGEADAEVTVARFCDGFPTVAELGEPTAPYVTFQGESGEACVLTQGNALGGEACGSGVPSASIELGCPWTSVSFAMQQRPYFKRELYIQSAYAFLGWSGEIQHGHVDEMVIDRSEGATITGHYRAEFPAAGKFPTVRGQGTFSLCATTAVSIDPCRQM